MSRAQPSRCGGASPAGNRISCCEWLVLHSLTPWHLAGPTDTYFGVIWDAPSSSLCPMSTHQLCLQSTSPNPAPSLYLWCHQPPLRPPAAICLLQSVLQAATRIFLKLQITSCHSPNLPVAHQPQNKTHTPPLGPRGGLGPVTSHRYLSPSFLAHLSQPQPPLRGSSNTASLFLPQDLCTCSSLLLPAPPNWLLLILPVSTGLTP